MRKELKQWMEQQETLNDNRPICCIDNAECGFSTYAPNQMYIRKASGYVYLTLREAEEIAKWILGRE